MAILRRMIGDATDAELAAIADTLTEIAIGLPGDDSRSVQTRLTAMNTLVLAGASDTEGTPYPVADRLLRIALSRSSVRGGAVSGLTFLADRATAIRMVVRIATSEGNVATAAVSQLAHSLGDEGLSTLRDLYRQGLIVNPLAQQHARALARYHGWTREPR
ncbi:MAG: hypothetical protein R2909_17995 [Gemmatimonadales bacterium]